jgi:hypothetical protein
MGRREGPATCEFGPNEIACLEELLRAMLTYEPFERLTTSAAVASEWMEGWAGER